MTSTVELPLWLFLLILLFAAVTAASHFLFPSVRWFLRRRMERAVSKLNQRLARPIEPFKLLRRHDAIQRLVYDPEVSKAIVEHSRETGEREDVAFERAKRYAREIVPSFSAFTYFSIGIRAARWLSKALYNVRVGQFDEEEFRSIDRESTLVFVINHRSNMDYVLVTYLAAKQSALSYAVGEWARIWPLSWLIKSMGAYFVRRRSRNALYRKVMERYVQMATQAGVAQAIFPEGGLSLNGAPAAPKLGLLQYISKAYDPDGRDIVFVPVALNYDRVLEDTILVAADRSGERRFRARLWEIAGFLGRQVWRKLRGRLKPFGNAVVNFGKPLSLRDFQAQGGAIDAEGLASILMGRIAQAVPILPIPAIATCLLHRPYSREELISAIGLLLKSEPGADIGFTPETLPAEIDGALEQLLGRDLILQQNESYAPNPERIDILRFYANSIQHLLPGDAAPAS